MAGLRSELFSGGLRSLYFVSGDLQLAVLEGEVIKIPV